MSNFQKPKFSLPGTAPLTPPPTTLPANVAALFQRYPPPWCVGPDGYLWVAADVEKVTDPDARNKLDVTPDGWRATVPRPRLVLEHALGPELREVVVHAVNALGAPTVR